MSRPRLTLIARAHGYAEALQPVYAQIKASKIQLLLQSARLGRGGRGSGRRHETLRRALQ
jgi:hypothetical protein